MSADDVHIDTSTGRRVGLYLLSMVYMYRCQNQLTPPNSPVNMAEGGGYSSPIVSPSMQGLSSDQLMEIGEFCPQEGVCEIPVPK